VDWTDCPVWNCIRGEFFEPCGHCGEGRTVEKTDAHVVMVVVGRWEEYVGGTCRDSVNAARSRYTEVSLPNCIILFKSSDAEEELKRGGGRAYLSYRDK
jgi:hypothetical protein